MGGITLPMTINPAIQHTYSTYGTYLVTIQYTINNAGSGGTLSYIYNYNCGGPNTSSFSAFANVDKNNKFTLTYSINSGKKYKFGDYDIKVSGLALKEVDINEIKNISNKF